GRRVARSAAAARAARAAVRAHALGGSGRFLRGGAARTRAALVFLIGGLRDGQAEHAGGRDRRGGCNPEFGFFHFGSPRKDGFEDLRTDRMADAHTVTPRGERFSAPSHESRDCHLLTTSEKIYARISRWLTQSTLAPEARTTLPHFSRSLRICAAICSGVLPMTSPPCLLMMSFTSAASSALTMSAWSLATTSFGVPAGTMMPNQLSALNPASPASDSVGRSGKTGDRRDEATPIPRSLPARTWGSDDG